MANETTRGTMAAMIATEILAERAMQAHLPHLIMLHQVHWDSIDGQRAPKKRYMVENALGMSDGGTEGVDAQNNVQFGMGTSVEVSTSEIVLDMAEVTEDTVMEALGVPSDVAIDIFSSGTQEQFEQILAPFVNRLIPRGLRRIEYELLQKLKGFSTSVGATNAEADIELALEAIYSQRVNRPLRPLAEHRFVVHPSVIYEWNNDLLSASGTGLSNAWVNKADYTLLDKPGLSREMTGLVGSILQYPVFEYDGGEDEFTELAPTVQDGSGTGVVSAFGAFGTPNVAPDDPSLAGKPGALVYLERSKLRIAFAGRLEGRSARMRMNARAGFGELVDKNATSIISKKRVAA